MKNLCKLFLLSALSIHLFAQIPESKKLKNASDEVFFVQDEKRGFQISLENISGFTLVTNLLTGERAVVEGEIAHEVTNKLYEKMLDQLEAEENISHFESIIATGLWSMYDDFDTPYYYLNVADDALVEISGKSDNPNENIKITLLRKRDWWFPASHGGGTITLSTSSQTFQFFYSNIIEEEYYKILFENVGSGAWSSGGYKIVN